MSKAHYIIPIFVPHEGCPHNCVFCNQSSITGSVTKVNKEFVRNTIEEYLKTMPDKGCTIEVSFFGGTFTAIDLEKQRELLSVAKEYKKANKIEYIRLSTRPDYIDKDILNNLKAYDVDIIELGVQSLDNEVLFKSLRGHSEEDVTNASKLIKSYGFTLGHQIMIGLPGDSFLKDMETTEKLIKLAPEIVRIYPALVIKDTPMEKMYLNKTFVPFNLEETIEISKAVYGRFISSGIKVIRVGLQPTEEINEGKDLIAGPFHPAFRELVEGSIINDMLSSAIPLDYEGEVVIKVNSKDVSKLYCNRKLFFNDMKEHLNALSIKVIQNNSLERGILQVEMAAKCINLSVVRYVTGKYKEGYLGEI